MVGWLADPRVIVNCWSRFVFGSSVQFGSEEVYLAHVSFNAMRQKDRMTYLVSVNVDNQLSVARFNLNWVSQIAATADDLGNVQRQTGDIQTNGHFRRIPSAGLEHGKIRGRNEESCGIVRDFYRHCIRYTTPAWYW